MSNWDESIEIAASIRAAVLAERKRCAELVRAYEDTYDYHQRMLLDEVAKEIEKEPTCED